MNSNDPLFRFSTSVPPYPFFIDEDPPSMGGRLTYWGAMVEEVTRPNLPPAVEEAMKKLLKESAK